MSSVVSRGVRMRATRIHFSGGPTIDAEVPASDAELQHGLRGRIQASPMLFIFPRDGRWPMTMTDVNFNLDFVFMDSTGNVVEIASNVRKGVALISSQYPVRYVLELPQGWASGFGLRVGDRAMMLPLIR